MAEYIEREAAIESIMSDPPDAHYQSWYAEKINEIHAADVAPVRYGHWNTINQIATGLSWKYRCNDCGCTQEYTHNYCPNCGARMDGGAD